MLAARLHEFGRPLALEQVPAPELESEDDVIVRVAGAGVCRTDLHVQDGSLEGLIPDARPLILGHENAGWVEAAGSPDAPAEGTPVLVHPLRTCGECAACRLGQDMFCATGGFSGLWADGGFAELLKTSRSALVVLPEGSDPVEFAPYADAGLTAYHAAKKASSIAPRGGRIAIVGIGGLGHLGVQLVRRLCEAEIIAVDTSAPARALALELGADHAVEPEGLAGSLQELGGPEGVDVVIDFVGEGSTPAAGLALLRPRGTYLAVGYGATLELPLTDLILREIRVEGNLVGSVAELRELAGLVERGEVALRSSRYPLQRVNDALADLEHGQIQGRAVIVPGMPA
jgi:NAD+-dependent secondary alcohol dehydrogenase Adh1